MRKERGYSSKSGYVRGRRYTEENETNCEEILRYVENRISQIRQIGDGAERAREKRGEGQRRENQESGDEVVGEGGGEVCVGGV